MKMRPPSVPLITVDPYFSVWSPADRLTDSDTVHWTGSPMTFRGIAEIDGKEYRFMGNGSAPAMEQTALDLDAFSTIYTFTAEGVELTAKFTSPVKPDDLYLLSRPVSYLALSQKSLDGRPHNVNVKVSVSEEVCLDKKGQYPAVTEMMTIKGMPTAQMSSLEQNVLARDGDNLRIDWGYFYITCPGGEAASEFSDGMTFVCAKKKLSGVSDSCLITFAYDDVKSIEYFGDKLKAYWRKNNENIKKAIERAHRDYAATMKKCDKFSRRMIREATFAGGEKYADILILSLRQSVAAHKLVIDNDGELLFISKECFSNGCAATVDVSYPSIPLYLIYNPELVRAMMRPIYKFAASDAWEFDFAPHDAGRYPRVNGQVYGYDAVNKVQQLKYQMPVEECGNMLIMEAAVALASGDISFPLSHMDTLDAWSKYLLKYGNDPENQLCTDDFAGHLAHNCNLSLKAIMGVESLSILKKKAGNDAEAEELHAKAKEMADSWCQRAADGDGSYRLAFNWEKSFSMKYNIVWDKLFGTGLFPAEVTESEFKSYDRNMHTYGLPLDNRSDYTKSDWYIWCGIMAKNRKSFEKFITPLWNSYNETESRVPLTDWYFTTTALQRGFQNRTVVGGHFIKLMEYKKTLSK